LEEDIHNTFKFEISNGLIPGHFVG